MKPNYDFDVQLQSIYLDGGQKIANQKAVVRMDVPFIVLSKYWEADNEEEGGDNFYGK